MSGDLLAPLVTALNSDAQLPRLADLGGLDLLAEHASELLNRQELPELIQLILADDQASGSAAGRDFLLAAAVAPRNPLVLEAVVEVFLSSTVTVGELGADLVDAWLQASREHLDLIGGIALEASTRLVLAEAGSPYALLDRMARLKRDLPRLSDDFAGRAVRAAGAIAEHFPAPEVPALLEALLARDDVADDAAFELGMLTLRRALASSNAAEARMLLLTARERLTDAHAEEERADAAAFGAAVDAILAYAAGAPVTQDICTRLAEAVVEFRLNMLGMPAGWRTPRFDTIAAWQQLVHTLEKAQASDEPRAWLHAPALITDLVAVYGAHRSLTLFAPTDAPSLSGHHRIGAVPTAPGLHAVLAPRVEHAFLAREGGLALLDGWLEELQHATDTDDDPTAARVREQAAALRQVLSTGGPPSPKPDGPAFTPLAGLRMAPEDARRIETLLAQEPELAQRLEAMIDARNAREIVDEVPIVADVYRSVRRQLDEQCPEGYTGRFAADVDLLLLYLLRFVDLRLSETQKFRGEASRYLRQLKVGEAKPEEKELGRDLRDFLRGQGLRVDLEVANVGAGRVDVAWRPHNELITIELKRDWTDVSWDKITAKYVSQAISYQVSGPALNFFMFLDLTAKPDGLAALPACIDVRTVSGPAGDPRPRTVIMLRVQGNKRDPSSL
ncbi:hypothetical protein AB0D67_32480 [Streptosporangium sp. NPDC048047]|uniref:hypothetical protein n=1 Tax=Streptosporangium sp. NPDC048047 TaxID=3155748 RepID=UPI00342962C6